MDERQAQILLDGKDITGEYFSDHNWHAFNYGEIVWLEDCNETPANKARFVTNIVTHHESIVYLTERDA